ncbi:hypothetical protein [Granulicella mallensis]|uniref:hypothetical protein n=1 Tax=Granulicella mallensis TaxID=940614 RepID=UPI0012373C64|nr:hypothetical protein [Granulicella mallensis]
MSKGLQIKAIIGTATGSKALAFAVAVVFWLSFRPSSEAKGRNLLSPVLCSYHPETYKSELKQHLRQNVIFVASTGEKRETAGSLAALGMTTRKTKTICAP